MSTVNSTNKEDGSPSPSPQLVDLNVGGVHYTTTLATLTSEPRSLLYAMFSPGGGDSPATQARDSKGKYFIDRDGVLFRYVLDFLRNRKLVLPENFLEKERLRQEAEYYQLPNMIKSINNTMKTNLQVKIPSDDPADPTPIASTEPASETLLPVYPSSPTMDKTLPGYVTVSYRGTFAFGRDGLADVKFRKLTRILVAGRVSLCRQIFRETLNESRDPDRGLDDRYTSRFFLKHTFLEQAFDMLHDAGFKMVGACASGANGSGEIKPGMESEESKWNHYNEFVFYRCI